MTELALAALFAVQPIVVDGVKCHPNRLLVKTEVANVIEKEGFPVVARFPEIGWVSVDVGVGRAAEEFRILRKTFGLDQVCLDRAAELAYSPTDPLYASNSWHQANIRADQVWDTTFGSSGIIVAVIDTGVKTDHEDLINNVWVNPGEIAGNGLDDDNNGYIDDINGYDFGYNDPVPNDVNGHGTCCSGIVAGTMNNSKGGCGVAPLARIMALKASIDSGYFYDTANIGAYLYAANNGAKILSCSFFSDRVSPPERDALEYVWSQGVLPIIAAGNAATVIPYYPASHEVCVSVAALNTSSNKAGFSDWGPQVDIATPGVSLVAPVIGGGYTTGFAGTSGACPVAAGAAALLWGANPSLTNIQIRSLLEDTAIPTIQSPFGEYTNYGRVDVLAASLAVPAAPARSAVVRAVSPLFGTTGRRTNSWTKVYGRGFAQAASLKAWQGSTPLLLRNVKRDSFEVNTKPIAGPLMIKSGSTTIGSVALPTSGVVYPMFAASSTTNGLTGGFAQALSVDGQYLTSPRNNDGLIMMESTYWGVRSTRPLTLTLTRDYQGGTDGTEVIKVYNWSTASYPYGTFNTLSTLPVSAASGTITLALPPAGQVPDVDQTVYVVIETSGTAAGTSLRVDQAKLSASFSGP